MFADYSCPRIGFGGLDPDLNAKIQRRLFTCGIGWDNMDKPRFEIGYIDKESINNIFKVITHSTNQWLDYYCDKPVIKVYANHLETLETWIAYHYPQHALQEYITTTPPPKPQPTINMTTNPYDMMVTDIINRVTTNVQGQLDSVKESVNKTAKKALDAAVLNVDNRVEVLVKDAITRYQSERVIITIENKRTTPPTITDVNEPTHRSLAEVIGILKSGCWCAIVGPTGGGKTLGGLQYARVSSTKLVGIKTMSNTIMPHDLIGFIDANGKYRKGAWTDSILGYTYEGGEHPQCDMPKDEHSLIIIDEMDNANANIIMLVKALATGLIAMPYGQQRINPNLQVLATMNTWGLGANREYVGRMAQDAALLNEFNFVEWDYDNDFEWSLLERLYNSYEDKGEYKRDDMVRLYEMFKSMRVKADTQKVRCIISTRNIINTAKMLLSNPKWTIHNTLKKSVYKGLKEDEIKRIECPEHWQKKEHSPIPSPNQKVSLYSNDGGRNTPF